MKDIRCLNNQEIALVLCYKEKENMLKDFDRFKKSALRLEQWQSARQVSYPFWLVCSMRFEDDIYAIGHHADDVEHPYYDEGVCQKGYRI